MLDSHNNNSSIASSSGNISIAGTKTTAAGVPAHAAGTPAQQGLQKCLSSQQQFEHRQ